MRTEVNNNDCRDSCRMQAINDQSDSELLGAMQAGDEEAFTLLYRRRHGRVYRFALQMSGSPSIAEDVTQEVFLFLIRNGRVFDPARGSLTAFLLGVARNYVLRRLRGEQIMVSLTENFEDQLTGAQVGSEVGPLDDLTRDEAIEAVRRAILTLPERYREVIVLCELQELSYLDAAAVLGCAIGTVRSRLHRARALLLAKLKPEQAIDEADTEEVKTARCFA